MLYVIYLFVLSLFCFSFFFFFSSRRRHTRFDCDWSSDVCSSDSCPGAGPWRRSPVCSVPSSALRRARISPVSGRAEAIAREAEWATASEPYTSESSMRLTRLSRLLAWGVVAAAVPACHDTGGSPTAQGPLAGLRYVNVVPDTGALDIRIIDIVGDAPATFGASFRTGGSPIGGAAQTSPPYQAVAAGQRHIRVFNSSSDPAIAQQAQVDTTFTFAPDPKYSFILHGFARPGGTPRIAALIA